MFLTIIPSSTSASAAGTGLKIVRNSSWFWKIVVYLFGYADMTDSVQNKKINSINNTNLTTNLYEKIYLNLFPN